MLRKGELLIYNCIFNFLFISGVKRRQASHKLIKQSSESVKVDSIRMADFLDHFWGHVFSASTETVCYLSAVKASFRKSKICNFDVSVMIDEQIFRF